MCIICNAGDTGAAYLDAHRVAADNMKLSSAMMLKIIHGLPVGSAARKRYVRAHKTMVKVRRAWNAVEHEREVPHDRGL